MKVINKLNKKGVEWAKQALPALLEAHAKQCREYEALVADFIRLRKLGDERAEEVWNKAFACVNQEVMPTAHRIHCVEQMIKTGEIWI